MKTFYEWYMLLKEPYASAAIETVGITRAKERKETSLKSCFPGYLRSMEHGRGCPSTWGEVFAHIEEYLANDIHYRKYLKRGAEVEVNTQKINT